MRIFIVIFILFVPILLTKAETPATRFWSRGKIINQIIHIAENKKVDPSLALAIADIESSFNPKAIRLEKHLETASVGLFQILHKTAQIQFSFKGSIEDLKKPIINITMGIKYLAKCQQDFGLDFQGLACCYQAGFNADPAWCAKNEKIKLYAQRLEDKYLEWGGGDVN